MKVAQDDDWYENVIFEAAGGDIKEAAEVEIVKVTTHNFFTMGVKLLPPPLRFDLSNKFRENLNVRRSQIFF